MRPSARLAPLLPLALLAALGCGEGDALGPAEWLDRADPRPSTRAELESARARWRAHGISSYDLEYRELSAWCCAGSFRVSVRAGTVASIAATVPIGPGANFPAAAVDDLFARLDEAFDEGAETVRATYDPRFGIPTRVYLDYRASWADDEVGWAVDEFRRVSR